MPDMQHHDKDTEEEITTPGLVTPHWFQWWDLVTFGGPGILVTIIAAWIQTTDSSSQAKALTWAVGVVFLCIYAAVVFIRWKAVRK